MGQASSKDKKPQPKHTGGKQERKKLTEDEAKALGLKKLPCCGKYGTHKPEDCRSSKTNVSQVNSAESKTKFNLVLLHQPRRSNTIPVESIMSVRSAVVPVQLPPVVAVSVPMASRNETYTIGHNTHVSELVLRELSEQWNLPESEAAQQ